MSAENIPHLIQTSSLYKWKYFPSKFLDFAQYLKAVVTIILKFETLINLVWFVEAVFLAFALYVFQVLKSWRMR